MYLRPVIYFGFRPRQLFRKRPILNILSQLEQKMQKFLKVGPTHYIRTLKRKGTHGYYRQNPR